MLRAFDFRKQQHPEGGLILTMSVHCSGADLDIIERFCGLADVLSPQVEAAPERTPSPGDAAGTGFYNKFTADPAQEQGFTSKPALEIQHGAPEIPRRPSRGGTTKR